ncbi:germinal-center associated nuclear protein-like [Antedon mediterranea]|uniref:germinal-center associated nuclear protein-like n=1 Tax=Antedon mediterranea TaxID=105859 RepID=UPI003AF8E23A
MDDKEDGVNPFLRRTVATDLSGSSTSNQPFSQLSSTAAPNVNPFAAQASGSELPTTNLFKFQQTADKPTRNPFSSKPLFSGFSKQPITSSTGFLTKQETSEGPGRSNFGGNITEKLTGQERPLFGGISSSKSIFKKTVEENSVGSTSSTIDPETGGPLVTASSSGSDTKELFTGKKIDFKRKPAYSKSGKNEASVRPRTRHDMPASKRGRKGDSDLFGQGKESRKIAKSTDSTFGDPASVDISDLEKFGTGSPPKSSSFPQRETKSAENSPHKRSIFGAALKGTGIKKDKAKEERTVLKAHQKDHPKSQIARQVPKSQISRQVPKSPEKCRKISVRGIPDELNKKEFLDRHFSKFGRIQSIYRQLDKHGAIITFRNHEDAMKAKSHGEQLQEGVKPVLIFLKETRPRRPTITDVHGKEVPKARKTVIKREVSPRPPASQVAADKPAAIVLSGELSKTPAYSATDRYQMLVDNDKLLRQAQGSKKQEELSRASAVRGSCRDMCPEKERYMREVQRRVHVFEMIPGTDKNPQINHAIAVKEYSRSSADQEAPLPHELRPSAVLNMTMDYLLTSIMDKGEGRWADWFDFVWNRTRGIRKDITQQHLCNLTAVDLVEKCARFHIYCAHRLCEAGTRAFDPKINNENLTKCLQSLKQFYSDLDEEGTVCPNEAEFRGYNVLLNLNQGDILREVQKYRFEVRESSQVKFAVQVFTALNSNNYVRFFKLVKSATYLPACALHRYFTQVRGSALETMVKAYSTARGGSYPLKEFVRQLSFEDQNEASEFCASHGLEVTDGDIIFESKYSFVRPSNAISATRALKLIESKNLYSIGQVVNNLQPLPVLEPHVPMTSFDPEGRFLRQQKKISITIGTSAVEEAASTEEIESTKKPEYSPEQIKQATKDLFLEVIDEMCEELSSGLVRMIYLMKKQAPIIHAEILQEVTTPLLYDAITMAYQEEVERIALEKKRLEELEKQRIEREKEKLRIEKLKARIAEEICIHLIHKTTSEELLSIAVTEEREVKEHLKYECILRSTFTLNNELIEETLQSELEEISNEVYCDEVEARRQRLSEIQRCMEIIRIGRYFKKWKNMHAARIRLKRAMYEFPSAPASISMKEQIEALLPFRSSVSPTLEGGAMLVSKKAKMSLETPVSVIDSRTNIAHSILQHHYLAYHQHQKAWSPLDLATVLSKLLTTSDINATNIYWKLVVSIPEVFDDEQDISGDAEILCDWLESKFTKGKISESFKSNVLMDNDKVNTISLYTSPINHHSYNKQNLSICVKCVKGDLAQSTVEEVEQRHQFLGMSAIMLALEMPENIDDQEYWLLAQLRLKNLLQAKPLLPAIPLVVCLLGWTCPDVDMCSQNLGLEQLEGEGLLSVYKIQPLLGDILDLKTTETLSKSVEWLALHQPKLPVLKQLPLRAFVDHGLMLFFTTSLYDDVRDRKQAGLPDQNPEDIVGLYNSVICHLCQVATSPHLASISWPVAEFSIKNHESIDGAHLDWNSDSQMLRLKSRISSLQLPDPPDFLDDWYNACSVCLQYVKTITTDYSRTKAPLINRVKRILERRQREFENTCYLSFDQSGCVPTVAHIPWIKIVETCISYKLAMLQDAMQYQEAHIPWIKIVETCISYKLAMLQDAMQYQEAHIPWIKIVETCISYKLAMLQDAMQYQEAHIPWIKIVETCISYKLAMLQDAMQYQEAHIPWIKIVETCISYKLAMLQDAMQYQEAHIPWIKIVETCISYKLAMLQDAMQYQEAHIPWITIVETCISYKLAMLQDAMQYQEGKLLSFDQSGCVPTVAHIPWIKIVETCISYKLAMLQDAMQYQEELDGDPRLFLVYYLESDLSTYKPPHSWKLATKQTADDRRFHPEKIVKSFYESANKKRDESNEQTDGADMLTLIKVISKPIAIVKETSETVEDFKHQLTKEKEEMKRLDKLLSACSEPGEDPLAHFTPTFQLKLPQESKVTQPFEYIGCTIEDKLQELRESIQRDRRANQLAELKLQSLLDD